VLASRCLAMDYSSFQASCHNIKGICYEDVTYSGLAQDEIQMRGFCDYVVTFITSLKVNLPMS
jgi:hypothetical protein